MHQSRYTRLLEAAGFEATDIRNSDGALLEMVRDIQGRLLSAEIMSGLGKINLAGVDFAIGKQFAQAASTANRNEKLGYVCIVARKAHPNSERRR